MLKPWSPEVENEPGGDYQDTVVLLQQEIARLEDELHARDEAMRAANRPRDKSGDESAATAAIDARLTARVEELNSAIEARDETIAMLLDQNRLLEEAEEAGRDEWNQLHRWVEAVERRVDGRDESGRDLEERLRAERSAREALEAELEIERKTWKSWREAAETELAHLRGRLVDSIRSATTPSGLEELEKENQRLRQECLDLRRSSEEDAEVDLLRSRVESARVDLAELERKLQLERDQRERETKEHEAEMAALRSRTAREAVERHVAVSATDPAATLAKDLSPDERIRAFREHLRDLHVDESRQKEKRGLSNRLSRLWNRTAPGS